MTRGHPATTAARRTDGNVLVQLEDVTKVYRIGGTEVRALDGLTLDIPRGEFVVILGPSGSGKTTLLNLLGGIDSAQGGHIVVDGRDITRLPDDELTQYRRHSVGFIFQFFNLIPALTALENVELAAELVDEPNDPRAMLDEVGLGQRVNHFPSELSGGEQQRVAIARALVTDPPLVLCDEPTGNLDEETGKRVLGVMRDAARRRGKTFVLVTHNSVISQMADRVVVLRDGRIASVRTNESPVEAQDLTW